MRIDPVSPDMRAASEANSQAAVELMRRKVAQALGEEPAAAAAMPEAIADPTPSKHQIFMRELSSSGKSLAEIQTEWHHYYTMLSDADKRQVWQEFYNANHHSSYQQIYQKQAEALAAHRPAPGFETAPTQHAQQSQSGVTVATHQTTQSAQSARRKAPAKPKKPAGKLRRKITETLNTPTGGNLKVKHHLQSLLFGLGMGLLVVVVLLFGFFNEYFIAPVFQPSRKVNDTPIIVTENISPNAVPTVIVPKINIEIPIDFELKSIDENTVQDSLNNGVVHYPSTVLPGEDGNGAYFGHSSQNVLNNGKYKFAFVLLHQLTTGDIFYVNYDGKQYAYEVFAKEIVPPSQVSVLSDTKGRQATATLITCDPPGFSTNRLVVWGEQVKPSVSTNTKPTNTSNYQMQELTGKGPSAWSRFIKILQFWKSD